MKHLVLYVGLRLRQVVWAYEPSVLRLISQNGVSHDHCHHYDHHCPYCCTYLLFCCDATTLVVFGSICCYYCYFWGNLWLLMAFAIPMHFYHGCDWSNRCDSTAFWKLVSLAINAHNVTNHQITVTVAGHNAPWSLKHHRIDQYSVHQQELPVIILTMPSIAIAMELLHASTNYNKHTDNDPDHCGPALACGTAVVVACGGWSASCLLLPAYE